MFLYVAKFPVDDVNMRFFLARIQRRYIDEDH